MVDEFYFARPETPRRGGILTPEQYQRLAARAAAAPPPTEEQRRLLRPILAGILDTPAQAAA